MDETQAFLQEDPFGGLGDFEIGADAVFRSRIYQLALPVYAGAEWLAHFVLPLAKMLAGAA